MKLIFHTESNKNLGVERLCSCKNGIDLLLTEPLPSTTTVSELLFSSAMFVHINDQTRGSVFKSRVDGLEIDTLLDTSSGLTSNSVPTGLVYAMDYDLDGGDLYYVDRNTSTLWSVPLERLTDSQDDRVKLLDGIQAWDMSYDWLHGYLYWTDDRLAVSMHALCQGFI